MLTLTIPGRLSIDVPTLREASQVYRNAVDLSGEGASTFPAGKIDRAGRVVARVSYNGRVWPDVEWRPGTKPIYDPCTA
jgi:hypothetical protein